MEPDELLLSYFTAFQAARLNRAVPLWREESDYHTHRIRLVVNEKHEFMNETKHHSLSLLGSPVCTALLRNQVWARNISSGFMIIKVCAPKRCWINLFSLFGPTSSPVLYLEPRWKEIISKRSFRWREILWIIFGDSVNFKARSEIKKTLKMKNIELFVVSGWIGLSFVECLWKYFSRSRFYRCW